MTSGAPTRLQPTTGPRARWIVVWAAFGVLVGAPVTARAGCLAMAPGYDGVLRLDSGHGFAWPCSGRPRHYAAAPSGHEAAVPPQSAARPLVERHETTAAPAPEAAPTKVEAAPAAADDVAHLKDQTARLEQELVRLNDETAGLRTETRRLREQLSLRRDSGDAGRADVNKADVKSAPSAAAPAAHGGNADLRTPNVAAPKGDLLQSGPAKDQTRPAPSVGEATTADQHAFERRKGVAQRAWNELLDFATRMRRDLSGKTE